MAHEHPNAEPPRRAMVTGAIFLAIAGALFLFGALGSGRDRGALYEAALAFALFAIGYVIWGLVVQTRAHARHDKQNR
jgi:hypothetical protein